MNQYVLYMISRRNGYVAIVLKFKSKRIVNKCLVMLFILGKTTLMILKLPINLISSKGKKKKKPSPAKLSIRNIE